MYRVTDAVNTAGRHVILYGDRGTGKTSIARVLSTNIQEPRNPRGRRAIYVSCTPSDDFTALWRRVSQEILIAPRQLGFMPNPDDIAFERLDQRNILDPNDARLLVAGLPNPVVVLFDEFDQISASSDTARLMAATIKLFADLNVPATIVIVGVADSITELFAEHGSIARNTAQIQVGPMSVDELQDVVDKGFTRAGMKLVDGLARRIAHLSQGYPSYTHLLSLWAGRRAQEASRTTVTVDDLDSGIPDALENAIGGVQQEYEQAIWSNHSGTLFELVIQACALAEKDSLGRFTAKAVGAPLAELAGKSYPTGAYQSHLAKFCEVQRGPLLKRSGSQRSYKWRFVNPQIIPYILIRGAKEDQPIDLAPSIGSGLLV
jgi:hypothetical protein